jgi:DNA integrity scanning protein DisA with diadenylate cyclase activity
MISTFLCGIIASPWMRAALRSGTIALAIVLFLLSIRRSGERVGRIAEHLETTEKTNAIQRRMLEAAARRPRDRDELVDRLRDGGF